MNNRDAAMSELSVSLVSARTLRIIDSSPWTNRGNAFWLEWNHPLEQARTIESMIQGLVANNWHRLIPPGSTCIDIGAHSGDTAVPMALFAFDKLKNERGRVVVVEPNPDLFDILSACLSLNSHLADFYLESFAVTSVDGVEVEICDHGNSNCNGGLIGEYSHELRERLSAMANKTYRAKGKSLENIARSHTRMGRHQDVKFIKTDCEGYDKEIIRSSREYLMQVQPALFVEWFAMFGPEDDQDFLSVFDEIGYEVFDPATLRPLDGESRPFDVLGVPRGKISEYVAP